MTCNMGKKIKYKQLREKHSDIKRSRNFNNDSKSARKVKETRGQENLDERVRSDEDNTVRKTWNGHKWIYSMVYKKAGYLDGHPSKYICLIL